MVSAYLVCVVSLVSLCLLFVAGLVSTFSHSIQEESVRFAQKDSPREDKAKPIS